MENNMKNLLVIGLVLAVGIAGFSLVTQKSSTGLAVVSESMQGTETTQATAEIEPSKIQTFSETDNAVCEENGKPIIRLFSTTWCPHCKWIKNAFESTVKGYVEGGKIVARNWEIDIGDDALTLQRETSVPESEMAVYKKFNPQGSVPTFVFGCKYYRIGNGYESKNDLHAEIAEFKAVIETLLK